MADKPSKLKIADREFTSRLLVGTGKFASNELMRDALIASGSELVTVALRRADLSGKHDPFANILEFIDPKRYLLLPNTSGAMNAGEAVRLARLAVAAGLHTAAAQQSTDYLIVKMPIGTVTLPGFRFSLSRVSQGSCLTLGLTWPPAPRVMPFLAFCLQPLTARCFT